MNQARRSWVQHPPREQLGLDVSVVGDFDARPVLAALAQHLVHRLHPFEHRSALVRVERLVLASGSGEIPAMQEHVVGVDHVDGLAERHPADVREIMLAVGGDRVVEQCLHRFGLAAPGAGGVISDRRASGQRDPGDPSRKAGNHSTRWPTTWRATQPSTGAGWFQASDAPPSTVLFAFRFFEYVADATGADRNVAGFEDGRPHRGLGHRLGNRVVALIGSRVAPDQR